VLRVHDLRKKYIFIEYSGGKYLKIIRTNKKEKEECYMKKDAV